MSSPLEQVITGVENSIYMSSQATTDGITPPVIGDEGGAGRRVRRPSREAALRRSATRIFGPRSSPWANSTPPYGVSRSDIGSIAHRLQGVCIVSA